jgi:type III secretion protein J
MRLLNQQGLPRRPTKSILDLYSTSGLVPSDVQEQIKYHAALGEQLANTVRKYDGVLDAEVQISFPKIDALNPEKSKGKITAAVWVKHSGILDDPNSHLKSKIQRLVSSAITGLAYDDVTVIGERSRLGEDHAQGGSEAHVEKQYVKTWGIIIGQESLTRFQIIFFTFCSALFLMFLLMLWVLWRTFPIISKSGGIKKLFSTSPLVPTLPSVSKEPTDEKPQKKEAPVEDKEGKANKNVDET